MLFVIQGNGTSIAMRGLLWHSFCAPEALVDSPKGGILLPLGHLDFLTAPHNCHKVTQYPIFVKQYDTFHHIQIAFNVDSYYADASGDESRGAEIPFHRSHYFFKLRLGIDPSPNLSPCLNHDIFRQDYSAKICATC